jgi:hypothetical protein
MRYIGLHDLFYIQVAFFGFDVYRLALAFGVVLHVRNKETRPLFSKYDDAGGFMFRIPNESIECYGFWRALWLSIKGAARQTLEAV